MGKIKEHYHNEIEKNTRLYQIQITNIDYEEMKFLEPEIREVLSKYRKDIDISIK